MPNMIDADELFKQLMERSRFLLGRRSSTYQSIGEAYVKKMEIDDSTKVYIAELTAQIEEVDRTIKTMQKLAGV